MVTLNLATHPVERVRAAQRKLAAAGIGVLLLTLVHGVFVVRLVSSMDESAPAAIERLDAERVQAWADEVDRLEAVADPLRARDASNAVTVANEIIAWHAFPWGALFADLEATLPDDVRLELVEPSVESDGAVHVYLVAAARDESALSDLLLALGAHEALTDVYPLREEEGFDGLPRLTLQARYLNVHDSADRPETGSP